ncbi:MAG: adaptor protein MecA [Clostridia bacterium]|nr:adaptor protein MecA [Clostridia bacterium]
MKIEKISYNKIKMTVSALDMIKWGVSLDNFVQDTPEARELFWTLIKRAEFETGFSFDDSRLMVEAMPHKYDGIVLFVTKIEDDILNIPQTVKKSKIRAKAPRVRTGEEIFRFDGIDGLINCLKNFDKDIQADLYKYLDNYYLIIYCNENVWAYFNEYGDRLIARDYEISHIREHGKLIAEGNAIYTIKKYF